MADEFLLTQAAVDELKAELKYLRTTRRNEVAEKIKEAKSFGDLSENSEYDEAKNEQAIVEARIADLEVMLKNVVILDESEIVIFGGVEDERYIARRLKEGKILIRYSERIYKEGQWKFISPKGLVKKFHDHVRYRNKPVYLLCSGAYVASDFSLIFTT